MKTSQNQNALLLRKKCPQYSCRLFLVTVCVYRYTRELVTQKEINKYVFPLKQQIIMIVSAAIG